MNNPGKTEGIDLNQESAVDFSFFLGYFIFYLYLSFKKLDFFFNINRM